MGCDVSRPQRITVLGATGSIGLSTLDVIARHPDRYQVFALSGYSRIDELLALCVRHRPTFAVVPNAEAAARLRESLVAAGCATEVLEGEVGLYQVASASEVDAVMAAIVGAAGLRPHPGGGRGGQEGVAGQQGGAGDVRRAVHAGGAQEWLGVAADRQ